MVDAVWQDILYAWRALRRTPAFTILTVLILAAGIGATTALFSVLDRVALRPLPYPDPVRLVVVHELLPRSATPRSPVNGAHFEEWRRAARAFDEMALVFPTTFTLSDRSEPERIGGARASASLFTMLGAPSTASPTPSSASSRHGSSRRMSAASTPSRSQSIGRRSGCRSRSVHPSGIPHRDFSLPASPASRPASRWRRGCPS